MALDKPLTEETISRLCEDVLDNLKSSGTFDDIREKLFNLLWNDVNFDTVVDYFTKDCTEYCNDRLNLTETRQKLRKQLSDHQDYDKRRYRIILKAQVTQMMEHQIDYVKAEYYQHGAQYLLKKFSPKLPDPMEETQKELDKQLEKERQLQKQQQELQRQIDEEIVKELEKEQKQREELDKLKRLEEEQQKIKREEENERRRNKQLEENNKLEIENARLEQEENLNFNQDNIEMNDEEQLDNLDVTDMEIESPSPAVTPVPSPLSPKQDFEELTMSSVSSIKTADLSDFDESIKLSEDEASIVGVTKDAKICIDEVKTKIMNLQTIIPPPNNDDASGSEKRTRKVNPKYSNEHYKLL